MSRLQRVFLVVCATLVVLLTLLRVPLAWHNDAYLSHSSGIWTALAEDFKDGTFYRPLYGPLGYGGTRYFPLFFVLHGTLLKLGVEARAAGYALTLVSMLALLTATFFLSRNLGANTPLAAFFACLVLSTRAAQVALMSIRGDLFPAALNVAGLAVCTRRSFGRKECLGAAILFTLAFAAKVTTVFGLAAVTACFLFSGRARQAWKLLAATVFGCMLVLASMELGSGGRVLDIMRACGGAGVNFSGLVSGPLRLGHVIIAEDPGSAAFFILASAALLSRPRRKWLEIAPLFFMATLIVTVMIYSTPGTVENHLIDLQVASLMMLTATFSGEREVEAGRVLRLTAIGFAAFLALVPLWEDYGSLDAFQRGNNFVKTLQAAGNAPGSLLAENPLLPILAGEQPFLLDPFMFRVLCSRNPAFAEPMRQAIRARRFRAIILEADPHSEFGKAWYANYDFGADFISQVEANYKFAGSTGESFIYVPSSDPPQK